MAKTKVSEWDSNASGNTDINGININEGCSPSTINNAIRETMAQVKDLVDGSSGDSLTNSGTLTSSGTLVVTGGLTLDGSSGTSGQFLTSTGAGNTPIWGGVSLGTMASQNSNAVNITGGSITGLTTLSTSGGTISATTLTATTTLGIGAGWTAVQDGSNNLVFKYSGVNKMKIDPSGNLTVTGDITAFGTI
jgi:hypothetical protein